MGIRVLLIAVALVAFTSAAQAAPATYVLQTPGVV